MPGISVDVENLDDDELFKQLSNYGVDVGPIVGSTRKVYQRKLASLLSGTDAIDPGSNGNSSNDNEYYENNSQDARGKVPDVSPSTRRRANQEKAAVSSTQNEEFKFADTFHTPSPRPSLRSVGSSTLSTTTRYTTPQGCIRETETLRYNYGSTGNQSVNRGKLSLMRILVKIIITIAILSILYIMYQYLFSRNPFEELEHMARETLAHIRDKKGTQPSQNAE